MTVLGQSRHFGRVPRWSGVPQQPEALTTPRDCGIAPGADIAYRGARQTRYPGQSWPLGGVAILILLASFLTVRT
jgi:hypothetical protein